MGKSAYILTQRHLSESIQGTQQRCQATQDSFYESFQRQQGKRPGGEGNAAETKDSKRKTNFFKPLGENVQVTR